MRCGLFLFFFSITLLANAQNGQTLTWKTLEDNLYTIEYPAEWELNHIGGLGINLVVLDKNQDDKSRFGENLNLVIQKNKNGELSASEAMRQSYEQTRPDIVDMKVLSTSHKSDGEQVFEQLVFTGVKNGLDLHITERFYQTDDNILVLSFYRDLSNKAAAETGKRMLDSFKLL
jgi:hypothetical protein